MGMGTQTDLLMYGLTDLTEFDLELTYNIDKNISTST